MDLKLRINSCNTVHCEPEWQWDIPSAFLPDFDLWYVWAGVGTLRHPDGADHPIHRGSLYVLRPGEEYHARHDRRRRLGVCYIHFDYLNRRGRVCRPGETRLPALRSQVRDPAAYETMLRRVIHLHHSADPTHRIAACRLLESVVMTAGADAIRADAHEAADAERGRTLDGVADWVREHPGERITVDQMADRAGYSVDHFTRLFAQRLGRSPVAFLIECRVDRARQLLSSSTLSLEQVADALGYRDVFYFSRQFKRQTGMPPAEWRQRLLIPASTNR